MPGQPESFPFANAPKVEDVKEFGLFNSLSTPEGVLVPMEGKPEESKWPDPAGSDDDHDGDIVEIDPPEPHAELAPSVPLGPPVGTRRYGAQRLSQLAKEEPFKQRATTKGFIRAILDCAEEEGVPDIDENRPGGYIEKFLNKLSTTAIGPRILHVRLPAAAWILKVPFSEVDEYLEQMERTGDAKPLGDGWWEITVNERMEPISI